MRKSAVFLAFLLFAALLLVHRVPGVLAQQVDQCTMSGSYWLPVDLFGGGLKPPPQSTPKEIADGLLDPYPQDQGYNPYFTAALSSGEVLLLTGHGIAPSCTSGKGLSYSIALKNGAITLMESNDDTSLFNAELTKRSYAQGYNHLDVTMTNATGDGNFTSATAVLVDTNGDCLYDTVEGFAKHVGRPDLVFDTPLQGATDATGRHYVLIPKDIDIGLPRPIDGPSFHPLTSSGCGALQQSNGVYLPATSDNSVFLQCGDKFFGTALQAAPCRASNGVPTLSGFGALLSFLGIFGLGIWAMRKTHFGNTLAGS
jgi:hypothetical protein